jgi:hypothetical protein
MPNLTLDDAVLRDPIERVVLTQTYKKLRLSFLLEAHRRELLKHEAASCTAHPPSALP